MLQPRDDGENDVDDQKEKEEMRCCLCEVFSKGKKKKKIL